MKRQSPISNLQSPLKTAIASVVALVALINVAWWQPYQVLAFNQMLGGTAAGARTFFMGWGEGLEQVADWLNQQPDITSVRTIALRVTSLNPYLKDGAQADFPKGDQLRDRTGYVVVYLPQTQGGPPDAPFGRFFGHARPLHVVRIHGVDFAWIYRAPPQVAQPRAAGFGPDIRLYGFDRSGEWRRGQTVLGAFGTAVVRRVDDATDGLRSRAVTMGTDLIHRFRHDTWSVRAQLAGSRVQGSPEAIVATQRSSAHWYQRPDQAWVTVDSAATSLEGIAGSLTVGKHAGGAWTWSASAFGRSPGFESNDVRFVQMDLCGFLDQDNAIVIGNVRG